MAKSDSDLTHKPRRARRPINALKIKRAFMLLAGLLTGFGSAVTGLGGHLALEPTLEWALGFSKGKAHGTALRFAFFTSLAGPSRRHYRRSNPCKFLLNSVALFLGANVGSFAVMRPDARRRQHPPAPRFSDGGHRHCAACDCSGRSAQYL